MAKFDPYSELGLEKNATAEDIKKAYRRKARKYHPDHNPDDKAAAEKFINVKKAYDILKDPESRQKFDNYGYTGDEQPGAGGFGGFQGGGFGINFEDIFESMFGEGFGGQRQQRSQKGGDVGVELTLSFEEAAFGVEKEVSARIYTACEECDGSGARDAKSRQQCSQCQGSGQIRVVQDTMLGRMAQVRTCPQCSGTGEIITDPCPNCRGQGRVDKIIKKKVSIPAGVDTGTRLRISGAGHAGQNGGPAGDLYVTIKVRSHDYFERKGQSILLTVPIGLAQAALGVELEVPTLEGEEHLVIPPGTQSGKKFRLAGRGLPRINRGGKGDQIVTVKVEVPKNLSEEQKDILRRYADISNETVENVDNGLLSRLKRVFGRR